MFSNRIVNPKNWSLFIIIAISLTYLTKVINFLSKNQQFFFYWDWPGHLDKALKLGWPWQNGWDNTFWGGYPTLIYPAFSHYLAKLFLILIPNRFWSLSIFIVLLFCLQLAAYYQLIKTKVSEPNLRIIIFSFFALIITMLSAKHLGTLTGTIVTGGFAANLGLTLFFFLLAIKNPYAKGLMAGLIILTHSIMAIVSLTYLVLPFIFMIYDRFRHHLSTPPNSFRNSFLPLIIALGIGSPWLVAYIDPAFSHQAANVVNDNYVFPVIIFTLTLTKIISQKQRHLLDYLLLLITAFTIFPSYFLLDISQFGIQGLHLYRLNLISLTLAPIVLIPWIFHPRLWTKKTTPIITACILIVITLYHLPQAAWKFNFYDNVPNFTPGRTISIINAQDFPDFPHLLEHEITQRASAIGSKGLFFESASNGLQFYEFANQIDPYSFKNGMYVGAFRTATGSSTLKYNTNFLSDLLGINSIITLTSTPPVASQASILGEIIDSRYQVNYIVNQQINNTPMAVSLPALPEYQPRLDLGKWWIDKQAQGVYTHDKINPDLIKDLDLSQPQVDIKSIQPVQIGLDVNSSKLTPILLKFTYNKYWRAQALNQASFTSQPFWITPGFMLFFAHGQILLKWQQPTYLYLLYPLSFCLITYCLYQIIFTKIKGD